MRTTFAALAVIAALSAGAAGAAVVSGVKVDDKAQVAAGGPELVLNGAGVRTRLMFDVYVAALYLPEKKTNAADVLAAAGPKRVAMTMMRDVGADQLAESLNEGIRLNTPPEELAKMKAQLDELMATMKAVGTARKGDLIALDFVPEAGTRVSVNGKETGKPIAGADFYRALLRIWLGEKPVQDNLKKALLGGG
ncbi:MAG: chalcone isomerase family protein [Burkholderiales bacterium]|nr:chalcone isomerase family protein [Burkholderiales bacterium]